MRKLSLFLCVITSILLISGMARADSILFEDFEDASGFTIGGSAAGYWGLAALSGTAIYPSGFSVGSSGQSEFIFYGAQAKEYSNSPPSTMTIALPDLNAYTNVKLTVALAATDGVWENSHRDSLHIIGGTATSPPSIPCYTAGCSPVPVTGGIDSFLPDAYGGNLQSQVDPSIDLHPQFQNLEYSLDSNLTSITFAFASSGGDEVVGIDSLRITGDPVSPVPEPATMLLLASGLVGLVGFRKKFRK